MIEKTIETSILLGLYETAMLLIKKNVEFVAEQDLTNQQWVILIHLAKDPNLPFLIREKHTEPLMASELADSLGVTRANITNLLTTLMDKGLIEQIEDKKTGEKTAYAHEKGESLIKKMQPERQRSNRAMLQGLSEQDKEQFLQYIQHCTENIQKL